MEIESLAKQLGLQLKQKGYKLATAESCTGGGIAYVVTHITGCSDWFERGFVTYSNEAKQELLGVSSQLLATEGAVSEAVALAMAKGALANSHANISIAVTGIAGPSGGTLEKPIGTVWIAVAGQHLAPQAKLLNGRGSRTQIREQAIAAALTQCLTFLA